MIFATLLRHLILPEDVVEGGEGARLDHAQEVEVAAVLVAALGELALVEEDELEHGQRVEGRDGDEQPRVVHHLPVHQLRVLAAHLVQHRRRLSQRQAHVSKRAGGLVGRQGGMLSFISVLEYQFKQGG